MDTEPKPAPDGAFRGGFKKLDGAKCPECDCDSVFYRLWNSSCGGYEDTKYQCVACRHSWWIDGPDA